MGKPRRTNRDAMRKARQLREEYERSTDNQGAADSMRLLVDGDNAEDWLRAQKLAWEMRKYNDDRSAEEVWWTVESLVDRAVAYASPVPVNPERPTHSVFSGQIVLLLDHYWPS